MTATPAAAPRRSWTVIGIPYAWLLLFFLLPFLIVLRISVSEMDIAAVKDVLTVQDGRLSLNLHFGNYATLVQDDLYFLTYLASLKYAAVTTGLCLAIGYPFAYFMARARPNLQPALLMLVMLPFWTSFLLRVYAWKALLSEHGWAYDLITRLGLDRVLAGAGLIPARESGTVTVQKPTQAVAPRSDAASSSRRSIFERLE